jgi:hypothetical protein
MFFYEAKYQDVLPYWDKFPLVLPFRKVMGGFYGINQTLDKLSKYPNGVAFLLYPISIHQVCRVADAHLTMPPKSTWVEPKLRSGMTIYSFDDDRI